MNDAANKKLTIALAYNKKRAPKEGEPEDLYAEFDCEETIDNLKKAIEANGYNTIMIEADEGAFIKLKEDKEKIDFVFNFSEGLRGESRESQISIYCELLQIPYLGSGPLTNAIVLDKGRTKEILSYHNVPTPNFQVFSNSEEELDLKLKFLLLVKPIAEGSSKGLKNENLVGDEGSLRKIISSIIKNNNQKAIAEEFLDGREFTVSVIGNENPRILPIVEVKFDHLPENIRKFDSFEAKWIYDSPEYAEKNGIEPVVCPASIDKKLEKKIKDVVLKTFKVLDCRDWARIDLRLDKHGIPNVLEVNVPAGLIKDPKENSRMPKAAYALGWSYEKLIGEILDAGLRRCGLK